MKVAIAARFRMSSSNGVDRTIEGHLHGMLARGYEVTFLTIEPPRGREAEELEKIGVDIRILPSNPLQYFWACFRERHQYDLLCLHSVFTPHNWLSALAINCPRIITPNGGYSPAQIRYRSRIKKTIALWAYERRMLEEALFVHVLSQNEVEQLKLVAPRARAVIAPNGYDSEARSHRAQAPSQDEKVHLLFIGRVALMHKGLDLLVRALSELPDNLGWQLDVIGPDEPGALKTLEAIMNGSGVEKKIRFHGPLYGDDKMEFINRADIFVHTSRYEGMPFAVIEAMAEGLPVLITSGTNMADLVQRQEAGWIVSDEVTSEELEEIISLTPLDIKKRGLGARRLIEEELDWKKISTTIFTEVEERLKSNNASLS